MNELVEERWGYVLDVLLGDQELEDVPGLHHSQVIEGGHDIGDVYDSPDEVLQVAVSQSLCPLLNERVDFLSELIYSLVRSLEVD